MILGPGVFVPAEYCAAVAGRLQRDARAQARANGLVGAPMGRLQGLVDELFEAAKASVSSGAGTVEVPVSPVVADCSGMDGVIAGLSTGEVASRLGKSGGYVRRLCRMGTFPGARQAPGGAWLIPELDVTEFHLGKAS